MKGKILTQILGFLENQGSNQIDLVKAILVSGYGANINKIDYEYEKIKGERLESKLNEEFSQKSKLKLQKFLSKLKKNGLIENSIVGEKHLVISKKGKMKLFKLKNKLPSKIYKTKKKDPASVIISFDIPEKFRKKRNWLREVIQNLGFEMIHKSVWIGKEKIPQDLIIDLEELKILNFVEIFEVTKQGTLKKVE